MKANRTAHFIETDFRTTVTFVQLQIISLIRCFNDIMVCCVCVMQDLWFVIKKFVNKVLIFIQEYYQWIHLKNYKKKRYPLYPDKENSKG